MDDKQTLRALLTHLAGPYAGAVAMTDIEENRTEVDFSYKPKVAIDSDAAHSLLPDLYSMVDADVRRVTAAYNAHVDQLLRAAFDLDMNLAVRPKPHSRLRYFAEPKGQGVVIEWEHLFLAMDDELPDCAAGRWMVYVHPSRAFKADLNSARSDP